MYMIISLYHTLFYSAFANIIFSRYSLHALMEFALGIEGVKWFVQEEPLERAGMCE